MKLSLPSPRAYGTLALLGLFTSSLLLAAPPQKNPKGQQQQTQKQKDKAEKKTQKEEAAQQLPAVLWRDPGDISSLDMINGAGGAAHAPKPGVEYSFVKEDLNATTTKFYAKDPDGVEWLVKLGPEAGAETAATRFTWAMGYFADEDYFLPQIHVTGLPKLKRNMHGASEKTGIVPNVRLKREVKKLENWDWDNNPFVNTRELNGLRVLMALMNNWDLTELNNKIYVIDNERKFLVSDLGATFGQTGQDMPIGTKGNVKDYEHAKFVKSRTADTVSFVMNTRPPFFFKPFTPKLYATSARMVHLAENIPVADAQWMGGMLAKLTPRQIRDAFRTAGYPPETVEGFARAFESRIAELNNLRNP